MSLIINDIETMEVNQERKMTLWEAVKKFFNERFSEGNTIADRWELINYIRELDNPKFNKAANSSSWGSSSIDTYRNYLHKAGYLSRIRNGVYIIEKEIPSHLTIEYAKHEAYNRPKIPKRKRHTIMDDVWSTADKWKQKRKDNSFIKENEFSM